jgi:hypothetical protein
MKMPSGQAFINAYAGLLTLALAVIVFSGFRETNKATFDEITTQRINLVEPDGSLRLVIADQARFPGSIIKGKEFPRPDRSSTGFIFLDEEGSEIGGQLWGGRMKDGKPEWKGSLTFDRYLGDEAISIGTDGLDGKEGTSIALVDGNHDIIESLKESARIRALPADQQPEAWKKFKVDFPYTRRLVLGRGEDKSVLVHLRDQKGRNRLVLKVDSNGEPAIELLGTDGKVTARMPPVAR